jgi:hypothetical protein
LYYSIKTKRYRLSSACAPSLALTAASPYAYANGATIYYRAGSIGSNAYTVTALVTDTLAGLDNLVFPNATSAGTTYPFDGEHTVVQPRAYSFSLADTMSGTLTVTATDRAGNATTQPFSVVRDAISPTASIQAPGAAGLRFQVAWGGQDGESGVRGYDVQYRVTGGDWAGWYTSTTQTGAPFVGEQDQSYIFRVRATD